MEMNFDRFAKATSRWLGNSWVFGAAFLSVVLWLASGPFFGWSDTWQLVANTATTVITFLMVFLLQNTQNRDTAEVKALLREIAEDLPEVDEIKAASRVEQERG